MSETMTAPKEHEAEKVWRQIVGVFKIKPDCEFDAILPLPAPPYSATWPYDGMVVNEELAPGCHLNRYYLRYTDETPWVEIIFNGEIN